jgi:hypothetical protein
LTALEILQGNEVHPTIFPKHPPVHFGIRQIMNFFNTVVLNGMCAIPIAYVQLYWSRLCDTLVGTKQSSVTPVNSAVSLLKFHGSQLSLDKIAQYSLYRSENKNAFKVFLKVAEEWTQRLGLNGYFYLVNVSPMAAPATTRRIQDIVKVEKRYHGAFAPAGPPPGEDIWPVMNFSIARKMVLNNYGVHEHNLGTMKPVAFIWDWLDVRNSAHLALCITINGVCMTCFRGLDSSLMLLDVPESTFPTPPIKATANTTWNTTMKSK